MTVPPKPRISDPDYKDLKSLRITRDLQIYEFKFVNSEKPLETS